MSHVPHSDLEVVPQSDGPEVHKHAYYAPEAYQRPDDDTYKIPYANNIHEQDRPRTICDCEEGHFGLS